MKRSLENISEESCNGCGACYQKCPKQCIRMVENDRGFLIPQIGDGCVACGLCVAVCPEKKNPYSQNEVIEVWAAADGVMSNVRFDELELMKKIEKFLREQKPELLHHQKFLENGTAERAKESGTEQNYNMIDGCVNNNPKKPRIIGNRISVLDRLHIKLEERKQKSQPQQQQQQERSRKN